MCDWFFFFFSAATMWLASQPDLKRKNMLYFKCKWLYMTDTFLWCISAATVCRYYMPSFSTVVLDIHVYTRILCIPVQVYRQNLIVFADGGVLLVSPSCELVSTSNCDTTVARSCLQGRLQENVATTVRVVLWTWIFKSQSIFQTFPMFMSFD